MRQVSKISRRSRTKAKKDKVSILTPPCEQNELFSRKSRAEGNGTSRRLESIKEHYVA